jgi:hypothetical protein
MEPVQSVTQNSLQNANPVTYPAVSGFISQHYIDGLHDQIKPEMGEIGFYFTEQVKISLTTGPSEMYRQRNKDSELIGWYFEAVLQHFDYDNYPFEDKTVWIQIRPSQFWKELF